mmetsp:Transcript_7725/g.17617  ORF Transcript_7725/g.17617 Transcript_7725/m.17617 type:complete len:242 (+) Transcript_7725:228-953(+)
MRGRFLLEERPHVSRLIPRVDCLRDNVELIKIISLGVWESALSQEAHIKVDGNLASQKVVTLQRHVVKFSIFGIAQIREFLSAQRRIHVKFSVTSSVHARLATLVDVVEKHIEVRRPARISFRGKNRCRLLLLLQGIETRKFCREVRLSSKSDVRFLRSSWLCALHLYFTRHVAQSPRPGRPRGPALETDLLVVEGVPFRLCFLQRCQHRLERPTSTISLRLVAATVARGRRANANANARA